MTPIRQLLNREWRVGLAVLGLIFLVHARTSAKTDHPFWTNLMFLWLEAPVYIYLAIVWIDRRPYDTRK